MKLILWKLDGTSYDDVIIRFLGMTIRSYDLKMFNVNFNRCNNVPENFPKLILCIFLLIIEMLIIHPFPFSRKLSLKMPNAIFPFPTKKSPVTVEISSSIFPNNISTQLQPIIYAQSSSPASIIPRMDHPSDVAASL